ncbi:hypothetical protein [Chryseobacterium sp. T1]
MRILKYLILPFFAVFVMAQTTLDQKVIVAAKEYKKGNYTSVINQLEKEPKSDYRVLFFYTLSKQKKMTDNNIDEVFEVKSLAKQYLNNFSSKNKSYTNEIENLIRDLNEYPDTKEEYYALLEQRKLEEIEEEKRRKISILRSQFVSGDYSDVVYYTNIYKDSEVDEYILSYYKTISEDALFKKMRKYDYINDLQKNRIALNEYLQTYGEKDSVFSNDVEARLKELNAKFPTTLEQYNLVLKDLERIDFEKELEEAYNNIVNNYNKKYYDATLQLIKDFPSNTKFDTDLLYYKSKSLYELLCSKQYSNTLTFEDIEIARNAFNLYLSKNNNKSSNEYQDASLIVERLRLNYPLSQKEWNKRKEDEKKLADKKLKEDLKRTQKANRYAKPLENFIAFGYEGGTIAKYGVRFEVGGGSFVGFFLNVRTSLIKDEEILRTNSEIKNKNEAIIGANFKLLKWAFFNLGGGYGFYKYPQRNDYAYTYTIQQKEYYAAYTGLTLRLGNRVNLVGGASFIDINKDFYAPEYTFGLTINLK